MSEATDGTPEETLFPKTVGERLRDARLAKRLELADVAHATKVPLRQLQGIEDGDYSTMPTPTYAVGFAKAYARAVGEDEVEIARLVRGRAEVSAARRPEYVPYETDEPPRTPSGGLMIGAIVLAGLVVLAAALWFGTSLFRGDGLEPAPVASESGTSVPDLAVPPAPTPTAAVQVTLVATDEVWVRIYDAAGQTLLQRTLATGERYDVPADADGPMINVGRPDKLQVLVNGPAVAPLGDGRVAIKDVGISAAALQARSQSAPAPATTASPAATAVSSPAPGRSIPAAFRDPPRARPSAEPTSTGQRDTPPAPAPPAAPPDNGTAAR